MEECLTCTSFCCLSSSFMRISLASALAALFAASLASAWGKEVEKENIRQPLIQLIHKPAVIQFLDRNVKFHFHAQHVYYGPSPSATVTLWSFCLNTEINHFQSSDVLHTAECDRRLDYDAVAASLYKHRVSGVPSSLNKCRGLDLFCEESRDPCRHAVTTVWKCVACIHVSELPSLRREQGLVLKRRSLTACTVCVCGSISFL